MNARDILAYGHRDVLKAIEGLAVNQWTTPGVTTRWSIKDVLAHLASFERLLEDAILSATSGGSTPTLDAMTRSPGTFNDDQVAERASKSPEEILREYQESHDRVMARVGSISPERLREAGTIPWYGDAYSLDDFIVYANYGHKREHCAQIRRFRQSLTG